MIGQVTVPAATAVANYDLFSNTPWKTSSRNRRIKAISYVGGNAINEAALQLMVGTVPIGGGGLRNTRSGVVAALQDDIIPLGDIYVPAGEPLSCIVLVAPTVSPIVVTVY